MRYLALPALLLLAACDRQSTPPPQQQPEGAETKSDAASAPVSNPAAASAAQVDVRHKGEAAPANAFDAPNGDSVTMADFKGRPLLVNLWATWCAPCLRELPSLDALAAREADGLQVLAISQDMKGKSVVTPWWEKQGFKLIQPYIDAKADMSFAYGGGSLPMTILYDKNGKEVWRYVGEMDWAGAEAKALIDQSAG